MQSADRSANVVAYGQWLIKWRWPVVIGSLLAGVLLASGAKNLWLDTNYRTFFSKENPQLNAFESLQDIYTKNDNIFFVLEPKDGQVFTRQTMLAIEELVEAGWQLPYAIRVDALTNFQHTYAAEDELIVEDLITDAATYTEAQFQQAKAIALAEPILYRRLIAPKADVTGVNVTLQLPGERFEEIPEAVTQARQLAEQMRQAHPHLNIYLTGVVMLNNAFSEGTMDDMSLLIPVMYLGMILVMIFFLRSISGVGATLMVITMSMAVAMGLTGWLGVGITSISAQAPTMIMTLAVADSIHLLVTMLHLMRQGRTKHDAIVESLRLNMQPVFLTTLTTAIGFLSMNFSDSPPFHHLGNITAAGVVVAFIYSVFFMPAMMAILPVRVKQHQNGRAAARLSRLAQFVIRRRRPLLWTGAFSVLLLAALVTRNQLSDEFIHYFDQRIQFRTDTDFAMQTLAGIYTVEFSIAAQHSGGISEPLYLETLDRFADWYRQQEHVVHVNSFSEVIKRLNKNMHNDDPSQYRIPNQRDLAAQYLLLYELSLPYGLDLNNQVNVDKSATRFTVNLEDVDSITIRRLAARGEAWLQQNAPAYMHATGASPAVMFSHISGRNIKGMLTGTLIALLLISAALTLALRNLKFGVLSLLPNFAPALMAFGLWGLLVGQINIALSVVASMSLGIIVDDTVHFLSKYLRARREQGLDPAQAVRYAFDTVGMALVVTSAILVCGFGILSFSAFDLNAGMGQLTAVTIAFALIADFLFLPPLLMLVEKRPPQPATPDVSFAAASVSTSN